MNRRKFLRRLTAGAAVIVATPVLLADIGRQRILIHKGNDAPTGTMICYGTAGGNSPGAEYFRKNYGLMFNHQFPIYWDEAGLFPKI